MGGGVHTSFHRGGYPHPRPFILLPHVSPFPFVIGLRAHLPSLGFPAGIAGGAHALPSGAASRPRALTERERHALLVQQYGHNAALPHANLEAVQELEALRKTRRLLSTLDTYVVICCQGKKSKGFGIAFYRILSSTNDFLFNEKSFTFASTYFY